MSASFGTLGRFINDLFNDPVSAWDHFKNGTTNDTNEKVAKNTNAINKQIADENLAFQRENLDYQKALQQQVFEREDTSYQRTVEDMRAAGLSPLSMQSTNGAGEVISTGALHNDYQHQGWTAQNNGFAELLPMINSIADSAAQRDAIRAQTRATDAYASAQELDNKFQYANNILDLRRKGLLSSREYYDMTDYLNSRSFRDYYGITNDMTPDERRAAITMRSLGFSNASFASEFDDNIHADKNGSYLYDWHAGNSENSISNDLAKFMLGSSIASGLGDIIKSVNPFPKIDFGSNSNSKSKRGFDFNPYYNGWK